MTELIVRPHPENPLGVRADLIEHEGRKPVELDFGDGSPRVKLKRSPVQHEYHQPGCYMVTALVKDEVIARQQVVVRGTLDLTGITVSEDMGGIRVEFGDVQDPTGVVPYVRVEWPGGDHEHAWGTPGTVLRNDAVPGVHEVRIVDTTSGRASRFPVEVAEGATVDPDFTVGWDSSDRTGMTVVVRIDAVANAPIHVWWDDADGPQVVTAPTVGMEIPHTYHQPGHYMQTVDYAGNGIGSRSKSEAMTVPARSPRQEPWSAQPDTSAELAEPAPSPADEPRVPTGDHWSDVARGAAVGDQHPVRPSDWGTGPGPADVTGTQSAGEQEIAALHPGENAGVPGRAHSDPHYEPEPAPVIERQDLA